MIASVFPEILLAALAVLGSTAFAPGGAPYLRWTFTARPAAGGGDDRRYHQEAVTLVGAEGAPLWTRTLPERMRAPQAGMGRGEVEAHERFPRNTQPLSFLVGLLYLPGGVVLADATGVLVLDPRDGEVLLDLDAGPADGDALWFDRGTFAVTGGTACEGPARGGTLLADCGDRLLYFNGRVLALVSKRPFGETARVLYRRADHSPPSPDRRPGTAGAAMRILDLDVRIEGVVYLR